MKSRYTIAYKGLSNGEHLFDFQTDSGFWANREKSEIKGGDVAVHIKLEKATGGMRMRVEMNGTVTVPCDRCLEDCEIPIAHRGEIAVKFSEDEHQNEREEGDILWVNPRENVIDLEQYIYETIVLSLPLQRVHPEDIHGQPLCNPAMLEMFKIVSAEEWARLEGRE